MVIIHHSNLKVILKKLYLDLKYRRSIRQISETSNVNKRHKNATKVIRAFNSKDSKHTIITARKNVKWRAGKAIELNDFLGLKI